MLKKKFFCVLTVLFLTIIFIVCNVNYDEEKVLDFRSMRDVELDVIISLGDSRERLVELLGEPEVEHTSEHVGTFFRFGNGMHIRMNDGAVDDISGENEFGSGRFEIFGYNLGMTPDQIAENLEAHNCDIEYMEEFGIRAYVFENYFDADGNIFSGVQCYRPENAPVRLKLIWVEDPDDLSPWINGIRLSLMLYE